MVRRWLEASSTDPVLQESNVAPTDCQVDQRSRDSCSSNDDELRTAALKLLQSSSYAPLRRIQCDVRQAVVILHGDVSSYFLKQMAQTFIQRLHGIQSVTNLVQVRCGE